MPQLRWGLFLSKIAIFDPENPLRVFSSPHVDPRQSWGKKEFASDKENPDSASLVWDFRACKANFASKPRRRPEIETKGGLENPKIL